MLRDLLQHWISRRNARAAVIRFFRETSGNSPIGSMTRIVATDSGGTVIRVCSGDTTPPRRDWFRVRPDGSVVRVDWQEAQAVGEKPWR